MVNKNKKIIASILIILAVAAGGWIIYAQTRSSTNNTPGQSEADKQAAHDRIKEEAIHRGETSPVPGDDNGQEQAPNPSDTITILNIYNDSSTSSIIVQTSLANTVSWRGCSLTVTNSAGTALKEQAADVIYQEPKSLCAGFSIPRNELSTGTLTFKLTGTTNDGKRHETTRTFSL